jgi:hypothetical protein
MEELRQIQGEDGLEDSSADGTPDKENEMMQEPGAANQIRGREEEALFTYEVCPLNFSYFHRRPCSHTRNVH